PRTGGLDCPRDLVAEHPLAAVLTFAQVVVVGEVAAVADGPRADPHQDLARAGRRNRGLAVPGQPPEAGQLVPPHDAAVSPGPGPGPPAGASPAGASAGASSRPGRALPARA